MSTQIEWLFLAAKKNNKVQTWGIENVGDGSYRTHEGFVDGTITISSPTFCEAKHIGKKNESDPLSQCLLEVAAKIQKKKDKGYSDNPDKIERPFIPTLAKNYKDHKKKVVFPAIVSPKLDGMRCILRKEGMFSRERNKIVSAPHIHAQFEEFFLEQPHVVIDGELYADKIECNFNEIMSLVKKQTPSADELALSKLRIEYHIFDIVSEAPYTDRMAACRVYFTDYTHIKLVPSYRIDGEAELKAWHDLFVDQGFEGTMIRWGQQGYVLERTDKLLKYKDFMDGEYMVSKLLSGRGKRENTLAKWELKMPNSDKTFEVGTSGTDESNKSFYEDRENIEGKKYVTIKYQELTPDGIPRFGNFVAIRDFL